MLADYHAVGGSQPACSRCKLGTQLMNWSSSQRTVCLEGMRQHDRGAEVEVKSLADSSKSRLAEALATFNSDEKARALGELWRYKGGARNSFPKFDKEHKEACAIEDEEVLTLRLKLQPLELWSQRVGWGSLQKCMRWFCRNSTTSTPKQA